MSQAEAWDREYKRPQLVSNSDEPQQDFKRFLKYLKKAQLWTPENKRVLDLGSGIGKNSIYLADQGAIVTGLEISQAAIGLARQHAKVAGVEVEFLQRSFGEKLPFKDHSFDLALDIMSSNSLTAKERHTYLAELARVLVPGGHCLIRLLSLTGDKHAATLLKTAPGGEPGTYRLPTIGITERAITEAEFRQDYETNFIIHHLERKSGYARVGDSLFKRQYWVGYLQKRTIIT